MVQLSSHFLNTACIFTCNHVG